MSQQVLNNGLRDRSNYTISGEGGGGGVGEMLHRFFCFLKKIVTEQDNVSKDTLLLIHLILQSNLGKKIVIKNRVMSHGVGCGSEKCQKSVRYYLIGPLPVQQL
jgi:hypothetical protein